MKDPAIIQSLEKLKQKYGARNRKNVSAAALVQIFVRHAIA